MNLKEHCLDEIELHSSLVDEGIGCLLHTILIVRAPAKFVPEDVFCRSLSPLVYAKCGGEDVDNSVIRALEQLKESLEEVGPNLYRGTIVLSFYLLKENKAFLGLYSESKKHVFERWRIPVLVDKAPITMRRDDASQIERNRMFDSCRQEVMSRMMKIIVDVNLACDHVPVELYEYEIDAAASQTLDNQSSMMTRIISSSPVTMRSLSQNLG
jgi:hypothetical protein